MKQNVPTTEHSAQAPLKTQRDWHFVPPPTRVAIEHPPAVVLDGAITIDDHGHLEIRRLA